MTQTEMLLMDLQRGQTVTPLQALKRYGCMRLSARVYDLRSEGMPVKSRPVKTKTGKMVSGYFLSRKP